MKKFSLLLIGLAFVIMSACDIIEAPFEENPGNGPDTTDTEKRRVLIEEFTGYHCGNCPAASVIAHEIEETYEGKVLAIGIHSGYYAQPKDDDPDYRSTIGTAVFDYYGLEATPNGLVNRTKYENNVVLSKGAWFSAVAEQLTIDAEVSIELTPAFNTASREISLDCKIKYLADQEDDAYLLNVYIIENDVIGKQIWYNHDPEEIEEYEHHNMLRGAMTIGNWGELVSAAGAMTGDSTTMTLNYTLPSEWNADHIKLVAMVMKNNDDYNVLNVNWCDLLEMSENTRLIVK